MSAIVGLIRRNGLADAPVNLWKMAAATTTAIPTPNSWRFNAPQEWGGFGWLAGNSTRDRSEQPFESNGLTLVADARLDNRREILSALGILPAERRQLSDGRLILEGYRMWGEDTPRRLLGDFAFAVWDARRQTLFCARDHRGKRPLFYHLSWHGLAIASSPKALLALPHVPRRLSSGALANFMAFIGDPAITLFDGLLRLPPAHSLTFTSGALRLSEYWQLKAEPTLRFSSDRECLDAFREVFFEAVNCRLRSMEAVGAFLSGGLDSSSVAGVAAHLLQPRGQRLTTFTSVPREGFVGPDEPGCYTDETPFVEAIRAVHQNLDIVYVRTQGRTFLDGLEDSFDLLGFPVSNPANRVWIELILEQAKTRGLRVLLNGVEGNFWMSYAGVSRGGRRALSHAARSLYNGGSVRTLLSVLKAHLIGPLLPRPVWRAYRRFRIDDSLWSRHSPMRAEFAAEMKILERYVAWPLGPLSHPERDASLRRVAHGTQTLIGFENDFQGAVRLELGIDMRDPTADKRLVEFCLRLPQDQFSRAGQHRLLVRRGMDGILPRKILWNPHRGIQAADWHDGMHPVRTEIAGEIERLQRSETAAHCLDLPRMRRALSIWPEASVTPPRPIADELEVLARGITIGRFIRWVEKS